jgi:hypothetical protein
MRPLQYENTTGLATRVEGEPPPLASGKTAPGRATSRSSTSVDQFRNDPSLRIRDAVGFKSRRPDLR